MTKDYQIIMIAKYKGIWNLFLLDISIILLLYINILFPTSSLSTFLRRQYDFQSTNGGTKGCFGLSGDFLLS